MVMAKTRSIDKHGITIAVLLSAASCLYIIILNLSFLLGDFDFLLNRYVYFLLLCGNYIYSLWLANRVPKNTLLFLIYLPFVLLVAFHYFQLAL